MSEDYGEYEPVTEEEVPESYEEDVEFVDEEEEIQRPTPTPRPDLPDMPMPKAQELMVVDPGPTSIDLRPTKEIFDAIDRNIEIATYQATAAAEIINQQDLFVSISGKRHVKVEGWSILAEMNQLVPRLESVERVGDRRVRATVVLENRNTGKIEARASATCGPEWAATTRNEDPNAMESMAQTRATSKACRMRLAWVMALAGYATTPAEEMVKVTAAPKTSKPASPKRQAPLPNTESAKSKVERNVISEKQGKRLWAIAYGKKWTADQVSELLGLYGYESTADIPWGDPYDTIIGVLELTVHDKPEDALAFIESIKVKK